MDAAGTLKLNFDAFELDEANARLTRSGQAVALPPKAFAVLCVLARQPGMLVTKDALLDAAWGHRHVSESVLKSTVSQLRIALDDDAKQPRYIETASRRGYRFIAPLDDTHCRLRENADPTAFAQISASDEGEEQSHWIPASAGMTAAPRMIGRQATLAKLRDAWRRAQSGQRQMVWIAGEAGVGKTTLIDSFLAELNPAQWVRGYCVEQYGAGEPYLPVLEATTDLCRRDPDMVSMLRNIAPTWLVQMPWLCTDADRATLQRELAGANQERMVREARELFDNYSMQHPLLFVTEDLHWSDDATLRLMDHFIRRKSPAHLMWLGSLRLAEVVAADDHPLKALRHELRLHRLVDEIALDSFSETEVADYLSDRFPDITASEDFVRGIHGHTDGLPLFLVNVLDDLASQGVLRADADTLPDAAVIQSLQVPESLAGVIERQATRLPAEVRAMLEAASVCGMEFRPSLLAPVLKQDAAWIAARCEELARRQQWLDALAVDPLPDGTLDARYVFRHALYRRVLYQGIGALSRAQLHRAVATAMEQSRVQGLAITSAELAAQYEAGQDIANAARHYADAAEHALRIFATTETLALVARGLDVLQALPESAPRHGLELNLVMRQAVANSQRFGMVSDEALASYARAEALCGQLPESPAVGWVLAGLSQARYAEGRYDAMIEIGNRIDELAQRFDDGGLAMSACTCLGIAHAMLANHETGQNWLRRGLALFDELGDKAPIARYFIHPVAMMGGHLAMHLVPTGHIDEARRVADTTLARARAIGHPMAISFSLRCYGTLEARLGEAKRVADITRELLVLADRYELMQARAAGVALAGWAQARLGDPKQGLARIHESGVLFQHMRMIGGSTQLAIYATEALILLKRWDEAQKKLDAALSLAQRIGERYYVPDLLLLKACIAMGQREQTAAYKAIQDSLAQAREQRALWYELGALAALCQIKGATAENRAALVAMREHLAGTCDVVSLAKAEQRYAN